MSIITGYELKVTHFPKTCPFCGADPGLARQSIVGDRIWYLVGCEEDECACNPQVSGYSLAEAWGKWDRRALGATPAKTGLELAGQHEEEHTMRLQRVTILAEGSHSPDDGAMCMMEAVAYVAGEPWSDHPACACPVISAFMRAWNDGLPDSERTAILLPFIPRLVGTKGSPALEHRRAAMAADWLIRVHTVEWLRLAKLDKQADLLASLPEITDFAQCPSLRPTLEAVRQDAAAAWAAARDAARAAARDAARAAAWDAAWDAAWAAAWDAARAAAWAAAWDAAMDAARDAAMDAAWAAARDAARAAARDALEPTKKKLQASAVDLVNRMLDLKDAA